MDMRPVKIAISDSVPTMIQRITPWISGLAPIVLGFGLLTLGRKSDLRRAVFF